MAETSPVWPKRDQIRPKSAKRWTRVEIIPNLVNIGQIWLHVAQIWLKSSDGWPKCTKLGQTKSKFGRAEPKFGRADPKFGRTRPRTLVEINQIGPKFGRQAACLIEPSLSLVETSTRVVKPSQFWPKQDHVRPTSGKHWTILVEISPTVFQIGGTWLNMPQIWLKCTHFGPNSSKFGHTKFKFDRPRIRNLVQQRPN